MFIIVFTEGKAGNLKLMRHDLSVELPFFRLARLSVNMVLLEERHTVVSVRSSKVVSTVRDHNFSDSIRVLGLISIGNHEVTSLKLFEFSGLRIEDSDVTVRSTNQELLTVFSELDARVELVFLLFSRSLFFLSCADGFLTRADVSFGEIVVVVLSVDVIPELEVAFSNSESNQTFGRMAGYSTDVRSDSVHENNHVLLFISVINCFENSRLQLHDTSVAVSDKELGAGELLGNTTSVLILLIISRSNDRLSTGERNTLNSAEVQVFEPGNEPEVEVVEADSSLLISTHEVLVIDSHEDIEGRVSQLNNLDESFLVVITDS